MKKRGLIKFTAFLTAVLMIICSAPFVSLVFPEGEATVVASAKEQNYTQGIYTYRLLGNNAVITRVKKGVSGEIKIPSTLGKKPVIIIEGSAFLNRKKITSVVIPNTVNSIGDMAFQNCTALKSITFGKNLRNIGEDAFSNCTSLKEVTVPSSVQTIGAGAFENCSSLSKVKFSKGLKNIGLFAFSGCNLKEIKLPAGLREIGYCAFCDNKNLSKITLPKNITSIGSAAFYNTAFLNDAKNWNRGLLYIGEYLIAAKEYVISCKVKDGTKLIAGGAFSNALSALKLKKVTLPQSLLYIGESAFASTGLKKIELPKNLKTIETMAFCGIETLKSIRIPKSVKKIGGSSFRGCPGLESVTIENGVREIGEFAFAGCTSLKSITIPKSVKSIEYGLFMSCEKLSSISLPKNLESIAPIAFAETAFEKDEKNWENGILYCRDYLINSAEDLNGTAAIKNGTKIIADSAFYGRKITSLSVPSSVKTIGFNSFGDCKKLSFVAFEKGIENIDDFAFSGCKNLKKLNLPAGIKHIGSDAFSYTAFLKNAKNQKGNAIYCGTYLLKVKNSATGTLKIKNKTTLIADDAFANCKNIKSVVIPKTVTHIGCGAFYNCEKLQKITIPKSVETIGDYALGFYKTEGYIIDNGCNYAFIIKGVPGSAAEKYAKKYSLKFSKI